MDQALRAVSSGNFDKVKDLLVNIEEQNLMNIKDFRGYSLVHRAVENRFKFTTKLFSGKKRCAELLLQRAPKLAEVKNKEGETPLLSIFNANYSLDCLLEFIKLLLEANPRTASMADLKGQTPLHQLVKLISYCYPQEDKNEKILDTIHLLIKSGANVNARNFKGWTPLHQAVDSCTSVDDHPVIHLLLDHGARYVSESRVNAISIACGSPNVLKLLLEKDSTHINDANSEGLTPLNYSVNKNIIKAINMLLNHGAIVDLKSIELARKNNISFEAILVLLENIDCHDINSKDDSGRTLLIQYAHTSESVDKLLQLGADVSAVAEDGTTALMIAVKELSIESTRMLIAAGANPLALDDNGQHVLSFLCKMLTKHHSDYSLLITFAEILFNLAQFKDESVKPGCLPEQHPQSFILKSLHKFDNAHQIACIHILNLILKSNIKDPSLTLECNLNVFYSRYTSYYFGKQIFGPISCLLNARHIKKILSSGMETQLDKMLDSGFSVADVPKNSLSPLTVLLCANQDIMSYYEECEDFDCLGYLLDPSYLVTYTRALTDKLMALAKHFIHCGVNVEDMSLRLNLSYHRNAELEFLRRQLWLPDALWMAFLTGNVDAVRMLLPHWSAPPAALLLFHPEISCKDFEKWFPVLIEYGVVPHGTEVHKRLQSATSNFRLKKTRSPASDVTSYSSPLSLRELSRYVVRASVAARASQPGNSLPDLLASICPPGLKDYLLMKSH